MIDANNTAVHLDLKSLN